MTENLTKLPLTAEDQKLIEMAMAEVKTRFVAGQHNLVSIIKTRSGKTYTGMNLQGTFGCIDICAEQITLGKVLFEKDTDIELILTVRHPKANETNQLIQVASPCGKCRELLIDYCPETLVIVRENNELFKLKARELVPFRYSKT